MRKFFTIFLALFFFCTIFPFSVNSEETVESLNQKISDYTQKLNELGKSKNTLANQIIILNSQIELTLLKISQTENSIISLQNEINNLSNQIGTLDVSLNQLSSVYIQQVTQNYKLSKRYPQISLLTILNFNDLLEQYKYVSNIQKNSQNTLLNMETIRTKADIQKKDKEQKQQELQKLKNTLASQKNSLTKQKTAKDNLLIATNNDEKKYQQLLTEAQNQLRQFKNFSNTAGGSTCLASFPGTGQDGNFFSQRDPVWCNQFMGNSQDTIGSVGCYISSIAMAYKKLGLNTTPSIYATDPLHFSLNTAYAVNPVPPAGYTYSQVNYSSSSVDKELSSNRYVIAQIKMTGSVSGMHFIVIISGSNGNYKIHDPWYGPDLNLSDHYTTGSIMSLRLFTK